MCRSKSACPDDLGYVINLWPFKIKIIVQKPKTHAKEFSYFGKYLMNPQKSAQEFLKITKAESGHTDPDALIEGMRISVYSAHLRAGNALF